MAAPISLTHLRCCHTAKVGYPPFVELTARVLFEDQSPFPRVRPAASVPPAWLRRLAPVAILAPACDFGQLKEVQVRRSTSSEAETFAYLTRRKAWDLLFACLGQQHLCYHNARTEYL